jgi:glycosyl transferase family 25
MEKQLDKYGLEWERFTGVDGAKLTEKDLKIYSEEESIKINGIPLTRGHMGCSLSHIYIYERIIAEDIKTCLVIEDDVILKPELLRVINESWFQEAWWDYIHLSYTPMSVDWLWNWLIASSKMIRKDWKFIFYFFAKLPYLLILFLFETTRQWFRSIFSPAPVKFFRPLYHTGAYFVSRAGAEKMLRIAYPLRFAADRLPNQARVKADLKFYGYCPPPIKKSDNFQSSTI